MRVAHLSYPMLLQRQGGLQVQLRETVAALDRLGVASRIFDTNTEKFAEYDVVHVYSALHGTYRIVEAARSAGRPVVISPVLHPALTRRQGMKYDFIDRIVGRLTRWQLKTSYGQERSAIHMADHVITAGRRERRGIVDGYGADPDRVAIISHAVSDDFRKADGAAFRNRFGLAGRIVLSVATVSPYKNQIGLIRALHGLDVDIVLIGGCAPELAPYMQSCKEAGGERVHFLGSFAQSDPLFVSAYAAADVFALPSMSETGPIVALEALAAGTPVVVTRENSLDVDPATGVLAEVPPRDGAAIRAAVSRFLDSPPGAAACREQVKFHTWDAVAERLARIYESVAAGRVRAAA